MAAAASSRTVRIAYAPRGCSVTVPASASPQEIEAAARPALKHFLHDTGHTLKQAKLVKLEDETLTFFYEVDPGVKTPLEKAAVPLLEERQNRRLQDQQADQEAQLREDLEERVADLTARLRKKTELIDELEWQLNHKEEENRLLVRDRQAQDAQWTWSLTHLHKHSAVLIVRTLRDEAREHVLRHVKKIKRLTPRHEKIELIKDWAKTYDSLTPKQKQMIRDDFHPALLPYLSADSVNPDIGDANHAAHHLEGKMSDEKKAFLIRALKEATTQEVQVGGPQAYRLLFGDGFSTFQEEEEKVKNSLARLSTR